MIENNGYRSSIARMIALRLGIGIVVATVAMIAATKTVPRHASLALHWYLIAVGAMAVFALANITITLFPGRRSMLEGALRRRPAEIEPPERLTDLKRHLQLASYDALAFHYRLRPLLRTIAAERLLGRRGIDGELDPAAAREVLGERVYHQLWEQTEFAGDRRGPGILAGALHDLVSVLERI